MLLVIGRQNDANKSEDRKMKTGDPPKIEKLEKVTKLEMPNVVLERILEAGIKKHSSRTK